jgi:hypothetical protein
MRQRRRRAELLAAAAVVSGAGCGTQFSPASQTRGSSSWLADLAQKQAVELGDPSPRRVLIATGRVDVVELWGRFVCGRSCFIQAGNKPPRGNYARITVDPRTRSIDGFALRTIP